MAMLISTQARSVPPKKPGAPDKAVAAELTGVVPGPVPAQAAVDSSAAVTAQINSCRGAECTIEVSVAAIRAVNIQEPIFAGT
jgi:hypothetical protein